jgi:hypothetical protein
MRRRWLSLAACALIGGCAATSAPQSPAPRPAATAAPSAPGPALDPDVGVARLGIEGVPPFFDGSCVILSAWSRGGDVLIAVPNGVRAGATVVGAPALVRLAPNADIRWAVALDDSSRQNPSVTALRVLPDDGAAVAFSSSGAGGPRIVSVGPDGAIRWRRELPAMEAFFTRLEVSGNELLAAGSFREQLVAGSRTLRSPYIDGAIVRLKIADGAVDDALGMQGGHTSVEEMLADADGSLIAFGWMRDTLDIGGRSLAQHGTAGWIARLGADLRVKTLAPTGLRGANQLQKLRSGSLVGVGGHLGTPRGGSVVFFAPDLASLEAVDLPDSLERVTLVGSASPPDVPLVSAEQPGAPEARRLVFLGVAPGREPRTVVTVDGAGAYRFDDSGGVMPPMAWRNDDGRLSVSAMLRDDRWDDTGPFAALLSLAPGAPPQISLARAVATGRPAVSRCTLAPDPFESQKAVSLAVRAILESCGRVKPRFSYHLLWDASGQLREVAARAEDPTLQSCVDGILRTVRVCPRAGGFVDDGQYP